MRNVEIEVDKSGGCSCGTYIWIEMYNVKMKLKLQSENLVDFEDLRNRSYSPVDFL